MDSKKQDPIQRFADSQIANWLSYLLPVCEIILAIIFKHWNNVRTSASIIELLLTNTLCMVYLFHTVYRFWFLVSLISFQPALNFRSVQIFKLTFLFDILYYWWLSLNLKRTHTI